MNRTMLTVTESANDLKHMFLHERDSRKRQRLHMLYLLASGHVARRSHLAPILGRNRSTISSWLALYEQGGLDALLAIYIPQGKAPALSPDQLDRLKQRLEHPDGFASYGEIQQWIEETLGVSMRYDAVHNLVHDKLKARPKVPRPSHEKKKPMS